MILTPKQFFTDVGERVGWSFAQNFVTVLLTSGAVGLYKSQNWLDAALVGMWAALFSLCTTLLAYLVRWEPTGQLAVFDRGARTFLQTFLAVMSTSAFTSFSDAGALSALALACGTAFLASLKSLIGLANVNTINDSTAVRARPEIPDLSK